MLFDPQVRAVGMTSDNPERSGTSHTLGAPGDQRTASHEGSTVRARLATTAFRGLRRTRRPSARSATVAHTWNGDGDESTKLHKPSASAPVGEAAPA